MSVLILPQERRHNVQNYISDPLQCGILCSRSSVLIIFNFLPSAHRHPLAWHLTHRQSRCWLNVYRGSAAFSWKALTEILASSAILSAKSLQMNSVGYFLGGLLISSAANPWHALNVQRTALPVQTTGAPTWLGLSLGRPLSWLRPGGCGRGHPQVQNWKHILKMELLDLSIPPFLLYTKRPPQRKRTQCPSRG